MQRILILIYVIVAAAIAVCTTILEIQPALFFIELVAPNPGDSYNLTFALVATMLTLLLPLTVFLLVTKVFRGKTVEIIGVDRTGIFVTRQKSFQSALIGIPVFINGKKAGVVDNGKTKFFDVPYGKFSIQAGEGKQASEKLNGIIAAKEQLKFDFNLQQAGLFIKIELTQIAGEPMLPAN